MLADHEVAADDPHILLAEHRFFLPHAVGFRNRVILIYQQRERQIELGFELLVRLDAIRADAQHHRVLLLDRQIVIPKAACLRGTSGGIILRIEVQHHALAAKIRQLDCFPGIGQSREIRGRVASLEINISHCLLLLVLNYPSIARQTFSDLSGTSTCRTPSEESASSTALAIAGVEPIVAASPMPLTPNGLCGVGVTVWSVWKVTKSSARGT